MPKFSTTPVENLWILQRIPETSHGPTRGDHTTVAIRGALFNLLSTDGG